MNTTDRLILSTHVKPTHYDVTLRPDLERFVFSGEETVRLVVNQDTSVIVLNTTEIVVSSAAYSATSMKLEQSVSASSIEYDETKEQCTITFPQSLMAGTEALLKLKFTGILNDKLVGFYRSSYKDREGRTKYMATTQFQATDARRAFPCWDEPALKATFNISLIVPEPLTALSNMPVVAETPLGQGLKEVKFDRTPVMSTYLIAFVVGELEYLEEMTTGEFNGRPIKCRVYTTPGLKEQGRFALGVAARTLEYYAEMYGIPYPLPKVDLICIPDFGAGAMENWGLITYRSARLLYDPQTSDAEQKKSVAYVVDHELQHQWFGNLTTMEWWSDLWLNEGFATWGGWLAVDKEFPEWDVWTQFVTGVLQSGLRLDALRSSHPIEVPVRDASDIQQIFDMISYSKGASVIRMLTNWLGVDVFLAGIRRYLHRHMYANATTEDLWAALSEESGVEVAQFMSLWTRNMGFPVLMVSRVAGEEGKIRVRQNRFLATGDVEEKDDQVVWMVPLNVLANGKPGSSLTLTQREEIFALEGENLDASSSFVKLNHQHIGVYRVNYTAELWAQLGEAVRRGDLKNASDRVGLIADAGALAVSGYTKTSSLLSLIRCYDHEDNYVVWSEIATNLSALRSAWYEQDESVKKGLKELQRALFASLAKELGWEYPKGENHLKALLRTLSLANAARGGEPSVIEEAKKRFERLVAGDSSAVHPNIRNIVYEIVVSNGGHQEYEQVLSLYRKSNVIDEKMAALAALGSARDPELIQRSLKFSISDEVREQDINVLSEPLGANPLARAHLWDFFRENFELFFARYHRSWNLLGNLVRASVGNFSSWERLREAERFFSTLDTREFARSLQQSLEALRVRASWVERDGRDVEEWLQANGFA
ncbi:uncharacterized protein VTP21DRAFT_8586 [Calcarisporiella thermophila]|uniref:uncharacterized protein n=1 Tax=Calcarisporiella thermophila TaxID=911321 RepID=UPI003742AC18